VFGLGEHHSPDFAVANPAVPLAAIAQATSRIRLASAVSVLSVADPVRVHQDFASLALVSGGRAEIIAGRSAFPEALSLFGVDLADYDRAFSERLKLLLAIRDDPDHVTWHGPFRPRMEGLPVPPRPQQPRLPLWLGVGGTPASVERAGRLGLPKAAAARTFGTAFARIRVGREHLLRWQAGDFPRPGRREQYRQTQPETGGYLTGEALDTRQRTGDVPLTRAGHRAVTARHARALGGAGPQHTWPGCS
jgi:alkanesulfonate monooxygenase SsuD/methylene tetrahydromethanopterin reductase-like flavin-dependent oxidoreductase (luciferase family)